MGSGSRAQLTDLSSAGTSWRLHSPPGPRFPHVKDGAGVKDIICCHVHQVRFLKVKRAQRECRAHRRRAVSVR